MGKHPLALGGSSVGVVPFDMPHLKFLGKFFQVLLVKDRSFVFSALRRARSGPRLANQVSSLWRRSKLVHFTLGGDAQDGGT
jgi:hypothetical protein